jgi:hypothetical protein
VDAQVAESTASGSDESEYVYPSDEHLLWWMEEVIRPEREEAYAEELAAETAAGLAGGDGVLTTACPNEPYSDNWIVGTTGDDVLIYGRILTGSYPFYTIVGTGVCRYSYSGGGCHIGTFQNKTMWFYETDYPLGIMGDPSGGGYGNDYIYSADACSASPIPCGSDYYVSGALRAEATFHICGDDCSVSSGDTDSMQGWKNRDILMGGANSGGGTEYLGGGYDDAGSDCIWGDNGDDKVYGFSCTVGTTEEIFGGSGEDALYGYHETALNGGNACERKIWGGSGTDIVFGGPGNDQLWGDIDNDDEVHGNNGNDYLYGGSGTGDSCDGGTGTDYCGTTSPYYCDGTPVSCSTGGS